eukprot:IDg7279t1
MGGTHLPWLCCTTASDSDSISNACSSVWVVLAAGAVIVSRLIFKMGDCGAARRGYVSALFRA